MQHRDGDISARLATAPVGRLLLKLAIPVIMAQLVNLLYNIVDRIYIGHMPVEGDLALTGVGICFPVVFLLGAFTALVAQGGAPRAAIAMGKGDLREAERILGNCVATLLVLSVGLTAVFLLWGEKLLWIFGASANTIGYAVDYMRIYAAGTIFVMFALGLNMFVTTQGYTTFSMLTVVIGAIANIILDPVFIYALDMGVRGAALATVLSQALSAAFVLRFLTGKRTKLHIRRDNLRIEPSVILPVMALGLAPFIMQSTEAILSISFNSSLQKYGGDAAVGAMTIANTVMQMIWLPAQGIGQGAQPIISYNYGAKNPERIRAACKAMLVMSGIFFLGFWICVQLAPSAFVRIFNDAQELLTIGPWALRIYTAVLGFFFIQMSAQQFFISIGKVKASLFIACLRKVILLIPLIFILPHFFTDKVFAVFLAEPVSDTISILTSGILFWMISRRELRKLEKEI